MEFFQSVLAIVNKISPEAWDIIQEVVLSALLVSPLMIGVKKWFSINGEKKMVSLVIVGSMLTAAATYLAKVPEIAPWVILVKGWFIVATTQPIYFLFIKPLFKKIGAWFSLQVAKTQAYNEAKAAAVPVQTETFSN